MAARGHEKAKEAKETIADFMSLDQIAEGFLNDLTIPGETLRTDHVVRHGGFNRCPAGKHHDGMHRAAGEAQQRD